jgi:hypothetical protein
MEYENNEKKDRINPKACKKLLTRCQKEGFGGVGRIAATRGIYSTCGVPSGQCIRPFGRALSQNHTDRSHASGRLS